MAKRRSDPKDPKGTLGTFAGVFTPSILTILGIILFLRLGYVVGNAGLGRALVIIAMANLISLLTAVSLSAIATNLKVKGGGDYYLISRTLGLEFGGAIGIVLFLAQSVSIAFYCIGFGEALTSILPVSAGYLPQIVAVLAVSFLFVFAWLGADWATRFQYVVMSILAAALLSFFAGGAAQLDRATLLQNWSFPASGPAFWGLFAIFFPAVTGFTQGVSMSGDLKDPGRSLPLGTFVAVGLSCMVYFAVAVLFAATLPMEIMSQDYGSMKRVARVGLVIDAGVIAATLSSAMASFLGAPRILQSIARDRIFPFLSPFALGHGPSGNPRRGVLLSGGIALVTIGLGNLNLIASVVSMFFLISYGLLNYATFYEARSASPSFRPRFRWFDARLSLLGALACLGVMLAINLAVGVIAMALLLSVYQYLKRTAGPSRWADSRRSYHLQRIREHLLATAREPEHPRDWRPQVLVFSDDLHRRGRLLRFASWLEGPSGLTTAVQFFEGEGLKMLKVKKEAEEELRKGLAEHHPEAFPLVVSGPALDTTLSALIQSFGIGPLRANTILLNWLDTLPGIGRIFGEQIFGHYLKPVFWLGCNILILEAKEEAWSALEELPSQERRIDVWWLGDATGRLLLLLAHLMTRSDEWHESRIRVLAPGEEGDYEENLEHLQRALEDARISAEPEVVADVSVEAILELSSNAAVVFLPFRFRGDKLTGPSGGLVEEILSRLPIVVMGLAAQDIVLDAEPEEGKPGQIAAALDAFEEAKKRAEEADRESARAKEDAEEKLSELQAALASGVDEETRAKVEAVVLEAKELAEKAMRRAAKALAKREEAAKAVEALGVPLPGADREAGEPEDAEGGQEEDS